MAHTHTHIQETKLTRPERFLGFAETYMFRVGKSLKEENPKTNSEKAEWSYNTTEVEMEKQIWGGDEMERLGGGHT